MVNYIEIIYRLITNAKFKYIYGSLRRRFIFYFARRYLNRQLSKRKGSCFGFGHCCKRALPWCRYLEDGKCSLYDRQPLFCRLFPIDEKDKELSDVKELCTYYFD